MYTHTQLASFTKQPLSLARQDDAAPSPHNLLDGFLVFLLPVLLHCGLLESLTVRPSVHTHPDQ